MLTTILRRRPKRIFSYVHSTQCKFALLARYWLKRGEALWQDTDTFGIDVKLTTY